MRVEQGAALVAFMMARLLGGDKNAKLEHFLLHKPPPREATFEDVIRVLGGNPNKPPRAKHGNT